MLALFSATLLLSAFLLFWVQPLVAKMILPLLGGSPSVWNTCMVFFQATLLGGYLYADVLSRRVSLRLQPAVHLALLLAAAVVLPVTVASRGVPPATSNPALWLLALLLAAVGLPVFALSATAPLVQRWFSHTGHRAAADPYFLYGASNLGSMLALLGFPVLIEPRLALDLQSRVWAGVYALFVAAIAACALAVRRSRADADPSGSAAPAVATPAPTARDRGAWLLLSFVPSSLLLGVTTYVTTDVAAVPFLWVVPLALYLGTFILAFARRPLPPLRVALGLQALLLLALGVALFHRDTSPLVTFPVHLAAFFATALVCHTQLAARRPAAEHLTTFYLWMSIGGVLGGIFNALVAPWLFSSVVEYLLVLGVAAFLRPGLLRGPGAWRWVDVAVPAGLLAFLVATPRLIERAGVGFHSREYALLGMGALAAAALGALHRRRTGFGLGFGAFVAAAVLVAPRVDVVHQERNFFGVLRVAEVGGTRIFFHGRTIHGAQSMDPAARRTPLYYHAKEGPLGEIFAAFGRQLAGRRIAIAGLGAGVMAAYGQPGQQLDFFELDPAVERVARDPRFFTFLADTPAATRVVIGDARLRLAEAPAGSYAMVVVDVFSSDSIPVHLLTREALRMYLDKLAPGGILAFHVSNAYLDLQPVLDALAADAGLTSAIRWGSGGGPGGAACWVVMARSLEDLRPFEFYPEWRHTVGSPDVGPWTDTFSNIFSVLKFRRPGGV